MFLLPASHAILEGHVRILTSDTQPRALSYKEPESVRVLRLQWDTRFRKHLGSSLPGLRCVT